MMAIGRHGALWWSDGAGLRSARRMLSLSPSGLLAACGGGGDIASTPPPPTGPSYQKLAEITASTKLAAQAATYQSSRPGNAPTPTIRTQATTIEISYDPTSKTYTLSGTPVIGSAASITQTFGPAEAIRDSTGGYEKITTTADRTDVQRLYIDKTTLTYTGYGQWMVGSTTGTDQTFDTAYFTYGIPTKTTDLPKTGSASYTLQIAGEQATLGISGAGSLTANFAAATVDVSLGLKATQTSRPGAQTFDLATVTGSGTIGTAGGNPGFVSNLAGGGYSGSINGLFYGPQAAEVGGAFFLVGAGEIVGAVVGRKN